MAKFVHLHTHSHYSFLEALPKVPDLVKKAADEEMTAIALTDAGNLHGAIAFYKAAAKKNIKAIIGVDAYLAPRTRFDKDAVQDAKRSRIILLAENNDGYKNLLKIVSASHIEGFFDKPRVDLDLLRQYKNGIIAIIPSIGGNVAHMLAAGDRAGASAAIAAYQSVFAPENLFLEITRHPLIKGHEARMLQFIELSSESGVPLVAQHDVYYLSPSDRPACEIMRRIKYGSSAPHEEEDFSFVNEVQMRKWFSHIPDAISRSGEIAERCNVTFDLGSWVFPAFPIPEGKTHEQILREEAYEGLIARGMESTPEVVERIEYELSVIIGKGFAPYFLAVSDLLKHAKSKGILTTTRGSAAGSLVSYLVGITNVDPLLYKLPFERFLNPERPKAPDVDMDFADNRRDEMIAYAKEKYGAENVAQIGTFGTMMARAAARDVARALGHSYGTGDRIAKLIPLGAQGFPMTIARALKMEPELKALYDEDDDVREILDLAMRIEGCARQTGVHAAGVVIAPTPLTEWTALQVDPKTGKLITQYDMHDIEEAGLLKFDFLGIKNLSILADAVTCVEKIRGIKIDIENIPIDDTKTFEMLARGETEGTFQLNGSGMTRYLKELQPTTIHDINAMVALYRPGPMEVIPDYIQRKNNPSLIKYLDPRMEAFLDASYGLLVYQDDLLYCAVYLAGYSWGDVDKFRKAIGKKIPAEMAAQKEQFVNGIIANGRNAAFADKLWKLFEPFQAYGFNKAHAACYGKVAYQTAYMKANYPVEYMSAVLTADSGDTESIAIFVAECTRMGIPVLPPDVNESGTDFTPLAPSEEYPKGAIRFGLSSIKNFGDGISHAILDERRANGAFDSLQSFLSRVAAKSLNRKSLESLIKSGALDRFTPKDGGRGFLLTHIEALLAFHRDATAEAPQDSLFGTSAPAATLLLPPSNETTDVLDMLSWEKELLGIYVSGHPLDTHGAYRDRAGTSIKQLKESPEPGRAIILPVLVTEVKTHLTKGGDKMAFVKFEDLTDSIEAVIFNKLYKEQSEAVLVGQCVLVKGTVSIRNGETTLAIENVKKI